ncbi:DUF2179 domain-containing protein [bacterium]|nr:DUF2179 domain-containing protein [bacterium]MBU1651236.1 DUF2179 domain-containing protein [bacterium]
MDTAVFMNSAIWHFVVLPLLICCARITDVSIGTVRIMLVAKSYRLLASVIGFFEALLWLLVTVQIIQHLTAPIYFIAYALGFALGNYVGIGLEHKLAMGSVLIRVITRREATALVEQLRNQKYIVTCLDAEDNDGAAKVFFTVVKRRQIPPALKIIKEFNPHAFYTVEDMTYVQKPQPMRTVPHDRIGFKRK